MEGDDAKLPLFHGNGTEDTKQYQFLCEAVWTVKQVQDDDVKKRSIGENFSMLRTGLVHEVCTSPHRDPNEESIRDQNYIDQRVQNAYV